MERADYGQELNAPPPYDYRSSQTIKEEVEFRKFQGQPVESTVVTIVPEGPPIRDHIIWSLFNTIYMNCCCLGLIAFVFSIKTRDQKLRGDRYGAMSYSATARSLNIAATVLSTIFILAGIVNFILQLVKWS
ncbi:dispanin subfamily A member 2b-like [Dendropsophus ebraccatus]|uniref:dispanin subfamily A member 2b-like n=1 Tax=Dendropsophus ebraccatus TaxID=150705 RepID=UPI003831C36E